MLVDVNGPTPGHGQSLTHHDALFVQRLVLASIHPTSGSVAGGMVVTLTGDGFSPNFAELAVTIGNVPCHLTHAAPQEVICVTGPYAASDDPKYNLLTDLKAVEGESVLPSQVSVTSKGMAAVCEGACEYTYDVAATPLIEPSCFSAQMQSDYSWLLSVCGLGFSSPPSANQIWVGGENGAACSPYLPSLQHSASDDWHLQYALVRSQRLRRQRLARDRADVPCAAHCGRVRAQGS